MKAARDIAIIGVIALGGTLIGATVGWFLDSYLSQPNRTQT
jgi:F0F1-type ATP synthase assembly protein I